MEFKLDHINMTVRDVKESIEWYRKVFNFELLEDDLKNETEPWAIVGKDDTMVCLYEDKSLKGANETESPFHRVYHFGLRVSDREEWEKRIKDLNLEVLYGGAYKYPNSVSWYVLDPSGHEIEVSYSGNEPLKFKAGQ